MLNLYVKYSIALGIFPFSASLKKNNSYIEPWKNLSASFLDAKLVKSNPLSLAIYVELKLNAISVAFL